MIKSNLAMILTEKDLSITQVSKDTNISRTTLTALCNNSAQGVQFDTINTLCKYLSVDLNELLLYAPFDYIISKLGDFDVSGLRLLIEIIENYHRYYVKLWTMLNVKYDEEDKKFMTGYDVNIVFMQQSYEDDTLINHNNRFKQIIKSQPKIFLKDIENFIQANTNYDLSYKLNIMPSPHKPFTTRIIWGDDFN